MLYHNLTRKQQEFMALLLDFFTACENGLTSLPENLVSFKEEICLSREKELF